MLPRHAGNLRSRKQAWTHSRQPPPPRRMQRRGLARLCPAIYGPAGTNMAPDHQLAPLLELIRHAHLMMPPRIVWKHLPAKRRRASVGTTASIAKVTTSAGMSAPGGTRPPRGAIDISGRGGLGSIGDLGITSGEAEMRCPAVSSPPRRRSRRPKGLSRTRLGVAGVRCFAAGAPQRRA